MFKINPHFTVSIFYCIYLLERFRKIKSYMVKQQFLKGVDEESIKLS